MRQKGVEKISVYPNPGLGRFIVSLYNPELTPYTYLVKDAMGKTIIDKQLTSLDSFEIQITDFPKGIYFIHVNLKEKSVVKKIIKL